jgi:hypothetical protein
MCLILSSIKDLPAVSGDEVQVRPMNIRWSPSPSFSHFVGWRAGFSRSVLPNESTK